MVQNYLKTILVNVNKKSEMLIKTGYVLLVQFYSINWNINLESQLNKTNQVSTCTCRTFAQLTLWLRKWIFNKSIHKNTFFI